MANMSDVLLSKLACISWCHSIECLIHGRESLVLLKYIVDDDYYAVMVTDMTLTYFECLDGDRIDEHYRRFNKGEIKRERLMAHISSILADITKADNWCFDALLVDCHTSRLTLKVVKPISVLKFEWSFYMISTGPDIFKLHVTYPLIGLVSTLRLGIDSMTKEIDKKDKLLEQKEANIASNSLHHSSDHTILMNKYFHSVTNSTAIGDNISLIHNLLNDRIIATLLPRLQNSNNTVNQTWDQLAEDGNRNNDNKTKHEAKSDEDDLEKRRNFESNLNVSEEIQATRASKKPKIKL